MEIVRGERINPKSECTRGIISIDVEVHPIDTEIHVPISEEISSCNKLNNGQMQQFIFRPNTVLFTRHLQIQNTIKKHL